MKDKIKICFVIDHLRIGGAGKLTIDVINGLSEEIFDINLMYLNNNNDYLNLKSLISSHVHITLVDISKNNLIKNVIVLRKKFKKYDIIHSCLEISHFYCSLTKIITPKRVKFVASIFGVDGVFIEDKLLQDEIRKNWSRKYIISIKYLQNFLFKFYDEFIAICNDTKNFLVNKRKINEDKIQVVYYGLNLKSISSSVDIAEVKKIQNELKIHEQDFIIGYIGRLSYGKGLEYLMEVFWDISKIHKNIKMILIGDGLLKEKLQNFLNNKSLNDKCIIKGLITSIREYYQLIDLFILPSFSEGIPLSVLEAMYKKKIVLTSNAGGLPEIIKDGINGFLFEKRNFKEMKKRILYIYEAKFSLNSIKENAFNTVIDKFNLEKNIMKISRSFCNLYYN